MPGLFYIIQELNFCIGRAAFEQGVAPEAEKRRRSATGASGFLARHLFHNAGAFRQTAKILLMQGVAGNGFHCFLQFEQGEFFRH